jgi:hypothetical protein
MMQRMIPISGVLNPCPGCGRQPKHWHEPAHGGKHFMECSIDGIRTPRFPTAQEAVEAWERHETAAVRVAA